MVEEFSGQSQTHECLGTHPFFFKLDPVKAGSVTIVSVTIRAVTVGSVTIGSVMVLSVTVGSLPTGWVTVSFDVGPDDVVVCVVAVDEEPLQHEFQLPPLHSSLISPKDLPI